MADGVKIPISAELPIGDVDAALQLLTQKINAFGQLVARSNKVQFNPIASSSVEDLRKVEQGFVRLQRIQSDLRRRMGATNQKNTGFFDLDWQQLYPDAGSRARQQRKAFEYVTGRGFAEPPAPAPGGNPTQPGPGGRNVPRAPAPQLAPRRPVAPAVPGSLASTILRRGLSGGLGAAGPVGGAVNGGINAGMAGGIGAGLAGFAGGMLAFGASALVGGIKDKVGAAQQENIGYDTIKRQLGDVGVSFNVLKQSIRASADAFDGTFEEAQNLAREFATLGNVSRDNYRTLAQQVTVGAGFGRAYGMEPSAANRFFGMQRGLGQTASVDDTRRLAITMGETIAKSGAFAKAEEVLSAAASFSGGQSRAGLTATNLSAYGGALAGLVSSGIPGMDVSGAAGMLSRMNSTISSGGAAGEAGQAFLYNAIGKPLGLDPVQAQLLREQGIFGTGAETFKPGSVASRFYGPGANFGTAASSTGTNIEAIMGSLRAQYGSNPSMLASALSRISGLNISQSMAFAATPPAQMGQLSGLLEKNGIDVRDVNATGIANLASIASGDHATLLNHASSLQAGQGANALSLDESKQLDAAVKSGNDGQLRDTLIKLASSRDQESTEGNKTRASINDVNKTLQKMADALVEPMNTMRNAMVYLAGGGRKSTRQINEAMEKTDENDVRDQFSEPISKAQYEADAADERVKFARQNAITANGPAGQHAVADAQATADAAHANLDQVQKQRDAQLADIRKRYAQQDAESTPLAKGAIYDRMKGGLAETDRLLHLTPGTAAAQMNAENGFHQQSYADRHDGGVYGIPQVMDTTLAGIEKQRGRKLDPNNPEDALLIQRDYLQEGLAAAAKAGLSGQAAQDYALRFYHGGPDTSRWGPKGDAYVQKIDATAGRYANDLPQGAASAGLSSGQIDLAGAMTGRYGNELPQGAASAGLSNSKISLEGTFNLVSPTGQPMAAPVTIAKSVGMPQPSGRG